MTRRPLLRWCLPPAATLVAGLAFALLAAPAAAQPGVDAGDPGRIPSSSKEGKVVEPGDWVWIDFALWEESGSIIDTTTHTEPLRIRQGAGRVPPEVERVPSVVGLTVGILRERALRSEEDLRETHDYLDNLIHYANAPIIVWDPAFKVSRFNHAFERLTGRRAHDVLGASLDVLFPKDQREEALAHIRRTLAGERMEVVEIPIQAEDGSIKTVLWNSANIYTADGKTVIATIAQGRFCSKTPRATEAIRVACGAVSGLGCSAVGSPKP